MANFGFIRAMQGVMLAFILVGSVAYLYFMAMPVSPAGRLGADGLFGVLGFARIYFCPEWLHEYGGSCSCSVLATTGFAALFNPLPLPCLLLRSLCG